MSAIAQPQLRVFRAGARDQKIERRPEDRSCELVGSLRGVVIGDEARSRTDDDVALAVARMPGQPSPERIRACTTGSRVCITDEELDVRAPRKLPRGKRADRQCRKDAEDRGRCRHAPGARRCRVIEDRATSERLADSDDRHRDAADPFERVHDPGLKCRQSGTRRVARTSAIARIDHDRSTGLEMRNPRPEAAREGRAPTVAEDDDAPGSSVRPQHPHLACTLAQMRDRRTRDRTGREGKYRKRQDDRNKPSADARSNHPLADRQSVARRQRPDQEPADTRRSG